MNWRTKELLSCFVYQFICFFVTTLLCFATSTTINEQNKRYLLVWIHLTYVIEHIDDVTDASWRLLNLWGQTNTRHRSVIDRMSHQTFRKIETLQQHLPSGHSHLQPKKKTPPWKTKSTSRIVFFLLPVAIWVEYRRFESIHSRKYVNPFLCRRPNRQFVRGCFAVCRRVVVGFFASTPLYRIILRCCWFYRWLPWCLKWFSWNYL